MITLPGSRFGGMSVVLFRIKSETRTGGSDAFGRRRVMI